MEPCVGSDDEDDVGQQTQPGFGFRDPWEDVHTIFTTFVASAGNRILSFVVGPHEAAKAGALIWAQPHVDIPFIRFSIADPAVVFATAIRKLQWHQAPIVFHPRAPGWRFGSSGSRVKIVSPAAGSFSLSSACL